MFCFTLYFQKGVAKCIVAIHCKIILFWNLKSISFAFIQCATPCHSLYYSLPSVDTRCHSLSLIVIRCHSLYHLLSRCHSLYHSLSFVATRCHSLSLVVRLVVTRCHSVYHWSVFFKQSYFINTFRNIAFEIYVAVPLIITFVPAKILGK